MASRYLLLLALAVSPSAPAWGATPPPPAWQEELKAVRLQPAKPERLVREAELLYRIGVATEEEAPKRKIFEEGLALATKARAENPKLPGAIMQWVVHASSIAGIDKNLEALRRIREIETALLELRELDPSFDHAGADRALGKLYEQAPMIISVGSTAKAMKHLRSAYERAPAFPANCLFLAEQLLRNGDKRDARKMVKGCPVPGAFATHPDVEEWTKLSRRILDRTQS